MEGPSAAYNIPLAVRLDGALTAALTAALGDVTDRHEVLRTVFSQREGRGWQRILAAGQGRPRLTMRQVAEEELARALRRGAGRAIDLEAEPPPRASLQDEQVLTALTEMLDLAPSIRDQLPDIDAVLAAARRDRHPLGGLAAGQARRIAPLVRHNALLLAEGRPDVFAGDLLVFAAGANSRRVLTADQGAGFCSGQVRELVLPCTHEQITQPRWLAEVARYGEDYLTTGA